MTMELENEEWRRIDSRTKVHEDWRADGPGSYSYHMIENGKGTRPVAIVVAGFDEDGLLEARLALIEAAPLLLAACREIADAFPGRFQMVDYAIRVASGLEQQPEKEWFGEDVEDERRG